MVTQDTLKKLIPHKYVKAEGFYLQCVMKYTLCMWNGNIDVKRAKAIT